MVAPTQAETPVRAVDQPVALSGSALTAFTTCPLQWFFEHEVKARGPATAAAGFGTVVHALARLVADGVLPPDPDVLVAQLEPVWSALAFEAAWQRDREREAAHDALRRLVRWLADRGDRQLLGSEVEFEVRLGDVVLRGAADRLEVDQDGRVLVVDFKTSRTVPTAAQAEQHPQLAAYQLAVRAGGFADRVGPTAPLGGAELVFLRSDLKSGLPGVRRQRPLPDDGPTWADELVAATAAAIRAEAFSARPGDQCDICAFRSSCPGHDAGEPVVR